jgi:hypothetical protein
MTRSNNNTMQKPARQVLKEREKRMIGVKQRKWKRETARFGERKSLEASSLPTQ